MSKLELSTPRGRNGRRLAAVISVAAATLAVVLPGSAVPVVAAGPPDAPVYFSTAGNTNPPGVAGTADDADIYLWNGTAYSRSTDVTAITNPLPTGANVDGYDRVDATHFYMSFDGSTTISLPGPDLSVQDEDVVYYDAGTWSVYFDGTPAARGLSGSDLDAISVVGTTLYFSTDDSDVPAGAGGTGDDADIYSWNGTSFTRVFDASALGWSTADVDGFVWVDATHFFLSYSSDTSVPVLGAVQDEDIVSYSAGTWAVYFDGTAHGLGVSSNLDIDAFAVPEPTVAQTISFAALAGKTFGDADFNVTATASSGLPVSFGATGSCTVVGTLVHLTGAGSCTITASQPGDLITYLPAPDVPQTFAIAMGSQTITFGALPDKNIYSSDFALNGTASSGLTITYLASGECSVTGGQVHLTGIAGSCTITATQPGDANYNPATDVLQSFNVIFVVPTAELYAVSGTTTLAGQSVNVLGYNTANAPVTQPGGPTVTVTQGADVILVLRNELSEATSLVVRGQPLPTDATGAAPGGFKAYSFTATEPGTFIYEAGPIANSQHQVAMGLYGALVVQPSAGSAYGSTGEAVVTISEVDPALNNAANPAAFDMRNFAPKYTLINGAVYASTANLAGADPGDALLLRYVNAGINYHSMSVLGANQRIVGDDGHALAQPYTVVAQTVGPGQTFDAVVDVSVNAAADTKLTVFDANLKVRNRNRRPATASATVTYGGAMGFITIGGTVSPTDTVGPVASNLAATDTSISAAVSDATTGNSDVDAAEYFIDAAGAAGTGTPMSGIFGSPTVAVDATFPALSGGSHTIYVRGHDAAGNWGPLVSAVVSSDNQGPASTGLNMTPNPTNGSADVALHATGSDVGTGGSHVTEAEYTIDGGPATAMNVNIAAVTVSLDVTISAAVVGALPEGAHTVGVRAKDAADNWGPVSTIVLTVDTTGPATSTVVVAPNPNNGTVGVNSSTPAVRVTATATDLTSSLVRAEGFLETAGADGTGFLFVPVDGVWNSTTEVISVDIPLTTIGPMSAGNHTIYVHAKDAAGNWGPTSTVDLVIDKTPPTVLSINRDGPSPVTAASVSFTVTLSEAVTGGASSNFAVVQGGGLFGASITSVTGTGATRTVTVATGSGGGTLGLNLTSPTGIKDIAGNTMASTGLPAVGQVYTLTTPPLYLSTFGNTNPTGVGGTADDADIYLWSGTAFSRSIDVSTMSSPLPGGANVDGFDRVDATHFYMSFNNTVTIARPGPDLTVQDEDVVFYNAGTWSVYFDGSPAARALSGSDLDAISIVGGVLYFSTDDSDVPAGVSGSGDDADIYSWNGTSFARVYDASALGWSTTNVDGFVWADATHFYVSYNSDTTVPVLGAVQDEDVVYYDAGAWSVYFDGTGKGLTNGNLDVDAFDLP